MNLLALLHSPTASGGDTTTRRIAAHLSASGYSVLLVPPADAAELTAVAEEHRVLALVGTHALLSGSTFLETGLPYVLALGGTDLNEYTLEPVFHALMTKAVERAAGLVAFNDDFAGRCRTLWPQVADKVRVIPQGVRTTPSAYSLRRALGVGQDAKLLLLPSGLRPVKDPLFAIDCVKRLHAEDHRVMLVIAGVSYDEDFEAIVRRRCGSSPAVRYVGTLPRDDLHAAMREATAVLNTSTSECSPNALLEAMDVGCPVVVRDIPGNTCLVEDEVTGLVFADPDGLRAQVRRLLDDEVFARRLWRRGQAFVRRTHSMQAERAAYAALFRDLVDDLPPVVDVPSRDRIVRANGVELCVQTFGDPSDPAILLVAGASASMLAWDAEFCELLAGGSRYVIRYDHRDTGRSTSWPPGEPPYGLRDLAADALGVLDTLGVARAHVVGISLGGMIAQVAALAEPARVASLTLVATSPGEGVAGPDLPPPALRVLTELADVEPPDWTDRDSVVDHLVAAARPLAGPAREIDEYTGRRVAGRVFDRAGGRLESAGNHAYLDHGSPWRPLLGRITAPTLVIHGAEDPIHPVAHAHALAAAIPGAAVRILDGAGHELARQDWPDVVPALLRHTSDDEGRISRATTSL
ncbi:glycosyl transferase/hydrolase [Amycolatopsis mediterranei S699]|uniref:Glycosyltransferase/hydrolase n=4 Tax=Amycolatopsis mediterranei TaxID=33910 RepID=A0A0H3DFG0_AMYMU|nr:alpha/beta fold hydrolase [Amycolatopsis mediterranei]ADJ49655.1 glycosyltransferase/hydrolase [Amycolatopsis mediterranei U32]AEK46639.1 glycosyl transferase/hydrolase [Amycolatopsis mediterranei S699]AFO81365.1 glycosyl transferase/hydrolase [Amycolatopsis mediterranei S699]AGT88493.1 glycosyl transferase/hydrolase [Amycolatopsis mediterranei RB]KDO08096.1 glycosyl transferase [Amycolatopsis mediterranei]